MHTCTAYSLFNLVQLDTYHPKLNSAVGWVGFDSPQDSFHSSLDIVHTLEKHEARDLCLFVVVNIHSSCCVYFVQKNC